MVRLTAVWMGVASLLAVATIGYAQQAPVRLDGLAALVGGEAPGPGVDVILRSDVELRARIALAGRTSGALPAGPVPRGLLKATLEEIIGEHLIAREARRVQAANPSRSDVTMERRRLVRSAGGGERTRALLESLSARSAELDAVAERRALVAAFLDANLEGATVVSDAEVERAFERYQAERVAEARTRAEAAQASNGEAAAGAGQATLASPPPAHVAAVRKRLRAQLAREALARTIERWVRVLRARTPVRIYADY